ncbi:MAG: magnesium transporter [Parachlamydiales bacterium]|jgi:magnesium transporter
MKLDFYKGLSKEQLNAPAGNYITPVETAFQEELTLGELIQRLQVIEISHKIHYFYVIDEDDHLKGVISTRDILYSNPNCKIKDITNSKIISIHKNEPLKRALSLIATYEILAIPVVDDEDRLCGILELPVSTILKKKPSIKEFKPSKDVFQLVGLSVDQGKLISSVKEFSFRMPWLMCNILGGLLCALIAHQFHLLLDSAVIIAIFIPLVLTLGESVSMQSMTLSLQFLHYEDIPWKRVQQRIMVEWKTALLLGVACALIVTLVYFLFFSDYWSIAAIASSIFLSMAAATTFGSVFPVILHIFKLDPKVASGPVVLLFTDITVTTIYLSVSSFLLI